MLTLTQSQNKAYAIFSISPNRWLEVTSVINKLPHKYVLGTSNSKLELSVVMPFGTFQADASFFMRDQDCYLMLDPVSKANGARKAAFVSWKEQELKPAGYFKQIASPKTGEDYTFDFETGTYYGIEEQ